MAQVSRGDGSAVAICYRRSDTSHVAGRLADRLKDRLGNERVFIDVDAIKPGVNFAEEIKRALETCVVLIVLIGSQWATVADGAGRRRLDDPDDGVVAEIRAALARRILVIPVLVDGAPMPRRIDLPKGTRELAQRQAALLRYETFQHDVTPLLDTVVRAVELSEQ